LFIGNTSNAASLLPFILCLNLHDGRVGAIILDFPLVDNRAGTPDNLNAFSKAREVDQQFF
jgi:hypothetical protein